MKINKITVKVPEIKTLNLFNPKFNQIENCSSTKSINLKAIESNQSNFKSINTDNNWKEERENINLTNRNWIRKSSQPSLYSSNTRSAKGKI